MQGEPAKACVYQPEPAGTNGGRIFAVAGPGTENFTGFRYADREEAEEIARSINRSAELLTELRALGVKC